jgi:hypothetical protein
MSEVIEILKEVGITEQDKIDAVTALGVTTPADFAELDKSDLIAAGLNPVQANKLIKGAAVANASANSAASSAGVPSLEGILPEAPDEESWLNALKVGGVLKPDRSTVIAAIRAALAEKVRMFDVPVRLLAEMEKFADENDEPVDPTFFKLRQQVTKRTYAEVFEAIPGLDAEFVTEARKQQLFDRMRKLLWPTVQASYTQLKAWHDNWMQGTNNPAMMMMAMTGGKDAIPAGMMTPPDTGPLRDCGDDINNAINAAFKGVGSQIAGALAYDSNQIRKFLDDPRLPALIGAVNRDQMIKKIGITISSNYARQEQNLVKYVLGFMQSKDVTKEAEAAYFSALHMLGSQLDWGVLGIREGGGGSAAEVRRPMPDIRFGGNSAGGGNIKIPDKL